MINQRKKLTKTRLASLTITPAAAELISRHKRKLPSQLDPFHVSNGSIAMEEKRELMETFEMNQQENNQPIEIENFDNKDDPGISPGHAADLWLEQYAKYALKESSEKETKITSTPFRMGPVKHARRRLFSVDKSYDDGSNSGLVQNYNNENQEQFLVVPYVPEAKLSSNNNDSDPDYIPDSDEQESVVPHLKHETLDKNNKNSPFNVVLPEDTENPLVNDKPSTSYGLNQNDCTINKPYVDTRGYQTMSKDLQVEFQQLVPAVKYPSYEIDAEEKVPVSTGGRRTRRHFCTFCKKEYARLPIHLERMHKDESLVKMLTSYPKGHEERVGLLALIRLQGEKEFNRNRSINRGYLKVARRPKGEESHNAVNYTPCPDCGRLLQKRRLYRHHAKCFVRPSGSSHDRALQVHSKRFRENIHSDANIILKQRIFPILRDDKYTRAIRFDRAAIVYGNIMGLRYSTSTHHDNMIRSNLRLLGKLILTAKKFNSAVTDIASLFRPLVTDTVVEAILEIAGFKPLQGIYRAPSTAASLVALCKVTAEYWKSNCVKREDYTGVSQTDEFILVFKTEVSRYINKTVIENRTKLQRQKTIQIPDAHDPELLTRHVKHGYERCTMELKSANKFNFNTWKSLGSYLIVALMLFNRRRPGEVERMELADYANIIEIDAKQPEYAHLEPAEKKLADTYKLFAIRGKLNRNVQILMNPKIKRSLQLFVNYRKEAGVSDDNPYIFGLPSSDTLYHKYLKAAKCMEVFSSQCNAQRPDLLRPTVLRKHMATRIAALDLPENDVCDLANHMGHAVDIHKGIYRQATLKRNVVKVTKMLKLVQGDPRADESSDDADAITDMDQPSTSSAVPRSPSSTSNVPPQTSVLVSPRSTALSPTHTMSPPIETSGTSPKTLLSSSIKTGSSPMKGWSIAEERAAMKFYLQHQSLNDGTPTCKDLETALSTIPELRNKSLPALKLFFDNTFNRQPASPPKQKYKEANSYEPRDVQQRTRWTAAAKAALHTAFKEQIANGVLPSGLMVQHAMRQYSPLRGRTVACIKSAVSNMLLRDCRLQEYQNKKKSKRKRSNRSSDSDDL